MLYFGGFLPYVTLKSVYEQLKGLVKKNLVKNLVKLLVKI